MHFLLEYPGELLAMKASRTPLILAIVMLLLPVLYVGSYLALVVPGGVPESESAQFITYRTPIPHYRFAAEHLEHCFWPLEQIDRMFRPKTWNDFIPPTT